MREELNNNQHLMQRMQEDIEWVLRFEGHIEKLNEEMKAVHETQKNTALKIISIEGVNKE